MFQKYHILIRNRQNSVPRGVLTRDNNKLTPPLTALPSTITELILAWFR